MPPREMDNDNGSQSRMKDFMESWNNLGEDIFNRAERMEEEFPNSDTPNPDQDFDSKKPWWQKLWEFAKWLVRKIVDFCKQFFNLTMERFDLLLASFSKLIAKLFPPCLISTIIEFFKRRCYHYHTS